MTKPVVIVGGGLAGLVCARSLTRRGIPFLLLETDDRVGGRLKTDLVEGFRLDRGFQVMFEAYPYAKMELNLDDLRLRRFRQGAYLYHSGKLHAFDSSNPVQVLRDPTFGLLDKWKLRHWRLETMGLSTYHLRALTEESAAHFLTHHGFSEAFMERFAKPFFGGIFLDRSLEVSNRQFQWVFKMLCEGSVSLPESGMEAIPAQIAADLPQYLLRESSRVVEILKDGDRAAGVRLDTNEVFEASAVVLATDPIVASQLSGLPGPEGTKSSTCVYFETPTPVVDQPMLVLNSEGLGRVNHVAPLSVVAPSYAPSGKHLISATILDWDTTPEAELAEIVKEELGAWFPKNNLTLWRYLRTDRIRYAQMPQPPHYQRSLLPNETPTPGLYIAGEGTTHSSIDGAIESGARCAALVSADVREPALA
jgi:phytoene dehydrogenase-like protein